MSEHGQTNQEFLTSIKVTDLPNTKSDVITISSTETPLQGFQKLVQNNILSAPVWCAESKEYTGFLDMKDLVSFVIYIDDDQNSLAPNNLEDIVASGLKSYKVPVDGVTVTYLSRRRPFYSVGTSDNLLRVIQLLSKGAHRVAVVDDKGLIVKIVSQSTVMQFLSKNIAHLGSVTHKTLDELKLGTSPVLTVQHSDTAASVFRLLEKKNKSSVAVVDGEGRLVGNTSSSDIKLFVRTPTLEVLKLPIIDFLKGIRNSVEIDIHAPVISIESHDSFSMLIQKLASTKVHKIFVANDARGYKPERVISITDVVRQLSR